MKAFIPPIRDSTPDDYFLLGKFLLSLPLEVLYGIFGAGGDRIDYYLYYSINSYFGSEVINVFSSSPETLEPSLSASIDSIDELLISSITSVIFG
jgi:hypothetical protein